MLLAEAARVGIKELPLQLPSSFDTDEFIGIG